MSNQHLQAVIRTSGVAQQAILPQGVPAAIEELQDFIAVCRDAREARKAQGKSSWYILITCTKKFKQF